MVPVAKMPANHLEGVLGEALGQEHGNLTSQGDLLLPGSTDELFRTHIEVLGDLLLDCLDIYRRL